MGRDIRISRDSLRRRGIRDSRVRKAILHRRRGSPASKGRRAFRVSRVKRASRVRRDSLCRRDIRVSRVILGRRGSRSRSLLTELNRPTAGSRNSRVSSSPASRVSPLVASRRRDNLRGNGLRAAAARAS
ncbi:hypothetical protein GCM10023318_58130 [Nocardia callitridis]|uniref:Uncharacterized protein n=1 Tax=Nocardia callitridis TaxID=648753 RepID=A0ABP9L292_9NOCA